MKQLAVSLLVAGVGYLLLKSALAHVRAKGFATIMKHLETFEKSFYEMNLTGADTEVVKCLSSSLGKDDIVQRYEHLCSTKDGRTWFMAKTSALYSKVLSFELTPVPNPNL